jgi:hypothetical protein
MVAYSAHEHYLLEVRNVDHLHVGGAVLGAARAGRREGVHLVLHNIVFVHVIDVRSSGHLGIHLRRMILGTDLGRRCFAAGVAKAKCFVLRSRSWVLVARVLPSHELAWRLNRRVTGRVVDGNLEWQLLSACHLFDCLNDSLDFLIDLRHNLLPLVLLLLQILRNHGQYAFDVRQLSSTARNLEVNVLNPEHRSVALHDLSAKVVCRIHPQGEFDTPLLYLTSGLDFGVLEVAMGACEGHDYNLTEEWNLGEQKSCSSLT